MNWTGLLIVIISLIYGILMLNGIEVPRLGKDNGEFWIGASITFFIAIIIMNYYEKKCEKKENNKSIEVNEKKDILIKYLCKVPILLVILYFASLLFCPMNEILLYIFLAAMIICKYSSEK